MNETAAARWASYSQSRIAQKRDARRRQAVRWERASLATAEALERMWIGSEAAWKRWEAGDALARGDGGD